MFSTADIGRRQQITIGIDPSRTRSGWAATWDMPGEDGTPFLFAKTGELPVPAGHRGAEVVREVVAQLGDGFREMLVGGFQLEIVVEAQHIRFASSAIAVIETRRLWEVYLYEAFGVWPATLQPSEWRVTWGLNKRGMDIEKFVLYLTRNFQNVVYSNGTAPRTHDAAEALLMALHARTRSPWVGAETDAAAGAGRRKSSRRIGGG